MYEHFDERENLKYEYRWLAGELEHEGGHWKREQPLSGDSIEAHKECKTQGISLRKGD